VSGVLNQIFEISASKNLADIRPLRAFNL